jgi:hypothetical protein
MNSRRGPVFAFFPTICCTIKLFRLLENSDGII